MNLILFGFKGCGKTTLGRKLAERMRRPFVDTDDLVSELYAQASGERLTSRQITEQIGESGFRALEKQAIFSLDQVTDSIIALGGGAILDPENVKHLQKLGQMVYLEASPDTLKKRMMLEGLPSFLKDTPFEQMYQHRKPIYESIAARRIQVDTLDQPGSIAALCSIILLEEPPNGF
jgi:shikimate kinase